MTTLFISGPMTGIENYNRPAFNKAAEELTALGYAVNNPAQPNNNLEDTDWAGYMKRAIHWMLESDALFMLPGWEDSRGSRIEYDLAVELDIPIMYHQDAKEHIETVGPTRAEILAEAERLINGDRNESYGSAQESFTRIADLWGAYRGEVYGMWDVALMMILVKVSRLAESPEHLDSWVDIPGYAALGGELSV